MRSRKPSPQTRIVLAAFADQPQAWRHGYDLISGTGLKSGTLYPLLIRLCDQGLLESDWQAPAQPGRPPRHVYRLTMAGLAAALEANPADQAPGALAIKPA